MPGDAGIVSRKGDPPGCLAPPAPEVSLSGQRPEVLTETYCLGSIVHSGLSAWSQAESSEQKQLFSQWRKTAWLWLVALIVAGAVLWFFSDWP